MFDHEVDILAFGPHPDDVDMGCSGTLLKMQKKGYSVGIIDLSAGEMGTRGSAEIRKKETEKANEILGIKFRKTLNIPDGKIWNNDENRKQIVEEIRKSRPKIVMAAHWVDDHPDHVQGGYLVKDAFYMSGFKNMYPENGFHRPKAIMYYMARREFSPTFIVDITEEFDQKMEAVKAFESQFVNDKFKDDDTPMSNPDFLDMFTARAKFYGRLIDCKYAEPFLTKNPPPVEDPVALWK